MDEKSKVIRAALVVVFVLAVVSAAYYLFIAGKAADRGGGPPPAPVPKPAAGEASGGEAAPAPVLNAPLDGSDEGVRGLAADLSSNPVFARWLKSKDLLRRFAAAVDNIAGGQSPRPQADFFAPAAEFKVLMKGGETFVDPSGYDRYNVIADVLDSISTAGCARFYSGVRPLLQRAYRELGYPNGDFHQTLLRAIVEILRTPVTDEPVALEKGVASWILVDPRLEELSPAQKHLFRMGPENLQLVQAKLREIALALGFGEAQLPRPRVYTSGKK